MLYTQQPLIHFSGTYDGDSTRKKGEIPPLTAVSPLN